MIHHTLRTFQPLDRVAQLRRDQILVGSWDHVDVSVVRAHARMVAVLAERGVDTGGRPPIWAWCGVLRMRDAALLLDPVHELSAGYATVTFTAPAAQVLLSDYAHWCEAMMAPSEIGLDDWQPRRASARSPHPEQACLPSLRSDWVTSVSPLPTCGWDTLDQELVV